jgi:hypothetical protein
MIRLNLVDNTAKVKHIDLLAIPVASDKDFACLPDALLPLPDVMRLSRKVQAGRIFGKVGKYLWYRLKEVPGSRHDTPFANVR